MSERRLAIPVSGSVRAEWRSESRSRSDRSLSAMSTARLAAGTRAARGAAGSGRTVIQVTCGCWAGAGTLRDRCGQVHPWGSLPGWLTREMISGVQTLLIKEREMTPFKAHVFQLIRRAVLMLALATGFAVLTSSVALAETLTVTRTDDPPPSNCEPGNCSLREAVNAANNDGGATIQLQAGRVYQLTQRYGAGSPNPNGGALLVLHNTEIVTEGSGNAAISGDGIERVFDVIGGVLTL